MKRENSPPPKTSELMSKVGIYHHIDTHYLIPQLSLLDEIVRITKTTNINFEDVAFIGVQHILETTVTLFDSLSKMGAKFENFFFSGKCYSTSPIIAEEVKKRGVHLMPDNKPDSFGKYEKACLDGIDAMWREFENYLKTAEGAKIKHIIILDEGGRCVERMPNYLPYKYKLAAIEQTRGGLYPVENYHYAFDLINVATSAIKKNLEPPLIAEAIIGKVKKLLTTLEINEKTVFGVIGKGSIGHAVAQYLVSSNYTVVVYDIDNDSFTRLKGDNFHRSKSIEDLLITANIVFSCTGKDITVGLDLFSLIKKDTTLISCSSEDKEFKTFLKQLRKKSILKADPLNDIKCISHSKNEIYIPGGGFPFNFSERSPWNVPASKIAVTQGLLLFACIQAFLSAKKMVSGVIINEGNILSLDPYAQKFVVDLWLPDNEAHYFDQPKLLQCIRDLNWIKQNSTGVHREYPLLKNNFEIKNKEIATSQKQSSQKKSSFG